MLLCSCIGSVALAAAGQSNTTTTDAVPAATTAPTMIAQQTSVSTGPAPTAQPTQKPTPTPKPTPKPTPDMYDANTAVAYAKQVLGGLSLSGKITKVTDDGGMHVTEYIPGNSIWDHSTAKTMIETDSFNIEQALWKSQLGSVEPAIYVNIQSDLTDQYGNPTVDDMGTVALSYDTEQKFNWSGLDYQTAWDNQDYDQQWLLPDLNK
jgi:hypothetical protein